VNLAIGSGDVEDGIFKAISWGGDNYYIKIEVDENGGTDYQVMGTSQLLAVPYALYAETSGNSSGSREANSWTTSGGFTYLTTASEYVGIGITNPSRKLEIYEDIDGPAAIFVNNPNTGLSSRTQMYLTNGTVDVLLAAANRFGAAFFGTMTNHEIRFTTNDAVKMTIKPSGYVGIGTVNPARKFEVVGDWQVARLRSNTLGVALEFVSTMDDWAISTWSDNLFLVSSTDNFATKTDEYAITSTSFYPYSGTKSLGTLSYRWNKTYSVDGDFSGKVGIGTTTPARTLEVFGNWRTARISTTSSGPFLEFVGSASTDFAIGTWSSSLRILSSTDNFASSSDEYHFYPGSFRPYATDTKTLGTSTKIWKNVYSKDGDFIGAVNVKGYLTGNQSSLGGLHVHDASNSLSSIYVTPATASSGDSARIMLAEDDDSYYGMYWMYDGGGNEMELWGKVGTTNYGPHIRIDRDDGDIDFAGDIQGNVAFTGNVAVGGYTPNYASGYKLSVDGKIMCEELRVNDAGDWPDYVFKKDYNLMSVSDLDTFIENNGHLPNIPSAEEIEESGIAVGEMQKRMMEKIEELSLYIIQQQKQIDELKGQINK